MQAAKRREVQRLLSESEGVPTSLPLPTVAPPPVAAPPASVTAPVAAPIVARSSAAGTAGAALPRSAPASRSGGGAAAAPGAAPVLVPTPAPAAAMTHTTTRAHDVLRTSRQEDARAGADDAVVGPAAAAPAAGAAASLRRRVPDTSDDASGDAAGAPSAPSATSASRASSDSLLMDVTFQAAAPAQPRSAEAAGEPDAARTHAHAGSDAPLATASIANSAHARPRAEPRGESKRDEAVMGVDVPRPPSPLVSPPRRTHLADVLKSPPRARDSFAGAAAPRPASDATDRMPDAPPAPDV
ncbi:hypothetical protein EON68_04970, partial [archaeon]